MSEARVTVTEAAIEAAGKAIYEDGWGGPPFWESMESDHPARLTSLATAQEALEAAAPHLVAFPMGMTEGEWKKYLESYR